MNIESEGRRRGVQPRGPTKKYPDHNNNNNLGVSPGGGLERGNPAMKAKRLRQGVKETHNIHVVGIAISREKLLCSENCVREGKLAL